jgi:septal ring factor EnvC (AmiA/AmiB activator)
MRGSKLVFGCLFLGALVFHSLVSADLTKKQNDLNQVLEEIKKTTKAVKQVQVKKRSLVDQLAAVEKEYGEIAGELKNLQSATAKKEKDLQRINEQIDEQNTQIEKIAQQLQGQVRSAYAMGKMKKLKLLLNQQDLVRANRIMVYFEYLNRERLDKLELTKQILQNLARLDSEGRLASQKLSQLVEQKQQEQTKLSNTRDARATLLAKLKEEELSKTEELRQLTQREATLRRLIVSLQALNDDVSDEDASPGKPFKQRKGNMRWPVQGRLSKKFGSRRGGGQWDGVVINTEEGVEVHAITRGRIVYADWLKGYGLLAIIDHGEGYMTLYAFNQSLYKEEGDWVDQGDIIAAVGRSGGRSQAGLYFGIRKKGKPLNPAKWCRKVRQGKVN